MVVMRFNGFLVLWCRKAIGYDDDRVFTSMRPEKLHSHVARSLGLLALEAFNKNLGDL